MQKNIIFLIGLYKSHISPLLGLLFGFQSGCRFEPTCAHYMQDAVRQKGTFRGAMLGLWRVLRCNPLTKGGLDPV